MRLRQALSELHKKDVVHNGAPLWQAALQLLPKDFALSSRMCANSSCRFSLHRIGEPARAHPKSTLCAWCDSIIMTQRQQSEQGRRLIAYALNKWANHFDVLLAAWRKLGSKFTQELADKVTKHWEQKAMEENDIYTSAYRTLRYRDTPQYEIKEYMENRREWRKPRIREIYVRQDSGMLEFYFLPSQTERSRIHPGTICHRCGQTYVWRRAVKPFECKTLSNGAVEDPLSYQKMGAIVDTLHECVYVSESQWNARANCRESGMHPPVLFHSGTFTDRVDAPSGLWNAGRHGVLRCTLCYEARCPYCKKVLEFSDYMCRIPSTLGW